MSAGERDENRNVVLMGKNNVTGLLQAVALDENGRVLVSAVLGGSSVTAASTIGDNRLVRGDGGSRGIQGSGITVSDADAITGVSSITVGNTGLVVGSSTPFSDASGTLTLQNVDALDATTEATIEAAIDTLANLTSIQGFTFTLTGNFIRVGAHSLTLTTTDTTDVTFPLTGTLATLAGSETLTNKTLTTPTIGSFANAAHNHTNAAGGGQLTDAALSAAIGVAKGGTGATSAADARTNLGLVIGTDVLAVSAYDDATAAETTTGTSTAKYVSPDGLAGSDYGKRTVGILVSDPQGSAITTGDGKAYFRVPSVMNGWNLVGVAASVSTVSSSGTPTIQIRNATQTADMLSTRITIDANETDSSTAATPAVIDTNNDDVATGDQIYIDIDVAGTGTKGLYVELIFQLP